MGRKPTNKNRKTTSIKINPELWKKFKSMAVLRGQDISDILEQLISKELEKNNK